jgi:hypothetical protein
MARLLQIVTSRRAAVQVEARNAPRHRAPGHRSNTEDDIMRKPFYKILYVQVLFAIFVGILLGHYWPDTGVAMKPLGDAFIKLIKMIIGPIIFCTVVSGIAGMRDMKKVGRVGGKALLYFEIVSTFALLLGLIATHVLKPGVGFNIDPATLDTKSIAQYVSKAHGQSTVDFFMHIIPTRSSAFANGDILQICWSRCSSDRRWPWWASARAHHPRHGGPGVEGVLPHRARDHEGGPDRRVRRDGLHHRQVRPGLADSAAQADRHVLPHGDRVRAGGAGHRGAPDRLLDHPLRRVHQGRTADRAGHQLVGSRAAAPDGEDGEARLLEVGGGPCRPATRSTWTAPTST